MNGAEGPVSEGTTRVAGDIENAPRGPTSDGQRATGNRDPGRWIRRAVSFPAIHLLALVALATFPVALPLAFLLDLVRRRRFALSRCVVFFFGYLLGEVAFLVVGAIHFLLAPGITEKSRARLLRWTHTLGNAWGFYLDRFGRRCFSVTLEVTGRDALAAPGPVIGFLRHASVADNLIAPVFFGREAGFDLRYVAKREVQNDPIFDIIGNRLHSVFVHRGSGDAEREIAAVTGLLDEMGPRDAIVVWPEGTRFSAEKRERILASIERRGDAARTARARALEHVLPPNLGGPVALLEAAVARGLGTDVVFCLHAGYEGAATFADLLEGRAIGRRVRIHFERVPFDQLPRGGREAIADWFFAEWAKVDVWVGRELPLVLSRA
jgi:hypothetical protein